MAKEKQVPFKTKKLLAVFITISATVLSLGSARSPRTDPQSLTYQQVLSLPIVKRAVTLHCVEGWKEHLLFEGVRLADLFARARPQEGLRTVIFHAADGYSSSLPYDDVIRLDVMLAAMINGRVLDAKRGFPFQVVAESKLGYNWVKWVTRIELSDRSYRGYWEKRGYDNKADVNK